jgi:hypothetical protein
MLVRAVLTILLLLVVAFTEATQARAYGAGGQPDASAWEIGPVIRGRNYSHGMPLRPTPGPRGSLFIDLPRSAPGVHYVTFRHGSLAGKRRIVMRYRIEADPGVRILPVTAPAAPSIITLYFQRSGDNWSARGRFEAYRWYAAFASHSPITPGTHEIVAPLDGNWTAVMTSSAQSNPAGFRDALANADQVGFVLGGGDGLGHGIFATGRARLIVTEFRVE